jgi:hypothetical protein
MGQHASGPSANQRLPRYDALAILMLLSGIVVLAAVTVL